MKKVSLQFNDVLYLLEYITFTKAHHCEIDTQRAILTGDLTEAEIELAVNGYEVVVIEQEIKPA